MAGIPTISHHELEVHLYMADNSQQRYYTDDPQEAARVLNGFAPQRLFVQKQFTIAGTYFMSGFQSAHVTRVDFIGATVPKPPHAGELQEAIEVTERELERYCSPRYNESRRSQQGVAMAGRMENYAEFIMTSGLRICTKLVVSSSGKLDQRQQIQNIINGNGFHISRRDKGLIVLNTNLIAQWSFFPGLPSAPTNTWPLHRLDFEDDSHRSVEVQKIAMEEVGDDS